jgi:hypothetical protein
VDVERPGEPAPGGGSSNEGVSGSTGVDAPPGSGDTPSGMEGGAAEPPPSLLGDVSISAPSQSFRGELAVSLSTAIDGAEIRYTVDRSLPDAASPLYSGEALTFASTTELRARAFIAGEPSGAPSTALYIARDFELSSDVPILIVDGFGLGEPRDQEVYVEAAVMLFEPVDGEATLAAAPALAARAGYHQRGSSSATFPQKSYRIELRDNADEDADYPLLGMPAEADWALIAPYMDRALIRNPFVYGLGHDMGLEAPEVRHAEVYVNYADRPLSSSDYAGVYFVTETIENSKRRTNLAQLEPKDTRLPAIGGGYIVKFDWMVSEGTTVACAGSALTNDGGDCFTDLEVVDPEPINAEQNAWLTEYMNAVHDALHAPGADYGALIDVPSFVDNFIINELIRNLDAYNRSAYYYKERDGKLTAGPLWDYNYSLDSGRASTRAPAGWQYEQPFTDPDHLRVGASDWYRVLAADPEFAALVGARWRELRAGLLSEQSLNERITALAEPLARAAERDSQRWPVRRVLSGDLGPLTPTWSGQVQAIRDWLSLRIAWLDGEL